MNKSFDLEGTLILREALASLSEIRVQLHEKFVSVVGGSEDLSIIDKITEWFRLACQETR